MLLQSRAERQREVTITLATFGDYPIKPYIPRVWGDFLDFLAIESDAEQLRPQPFPSMSQEVKAAIEVASTHTNSMFVVIKRNYRCDDDIDRFRID